MSIGARAAAADAELLGLSRPMPAAFYDGTTGIEPVDTVIRRVLRHAYCHHIERLMILGNFMLLCEIDPGRSTSGSWNCSSTPTIG